MSYCTRASGLYTCRCIPMLVRCKSDRLHTLLSQRPVSRLPAVLSHWHSLSNLAGDMEARTRDQRVQRVQCPYVTGGVRIAGAWNGSSSGTQDSLPFPFTIPFPHLAPSRLPRRLAPSPPRQPWASSSDSSHWAAASLARTRRSSRRACAWTPRAVSFSTIRRPRAQGRAARGTRIRTRARVGSSGLRRPSSRSWPRSTTLRCRRSVSVVAPVVWVRELTRRAQPALRKTCSRRPYCLPLLRLLLWRLRPEFSVVGRTS